MRFRKTIISLLTVCVMFCTGFSNITAYASTTTRTLFVDADINININGYTPTVSGTIACTESKIASVSVINTTNNSTIYNETITSEDGVHNVSFTLPSLFNPKEYEVNVTCTDGNKTLANNTLIPYSE